MATKGATPSSVRASNGDFHKCRCDQQPANKTCCPTNVSHRLKPEAQKYPASRGCKTSHGQGAGPGYKGGGTPPLWVSCRGGACPYPLSSRPLPHLLLLSLGQVRRQRVNLFTRLEPISAVVFSSRHIGYNSRQLDKVQKATRPTKQRKMRKRTGTSNEHMARTQKMRERTSCLSFTFRLYRVQSAGSPAQENTSRFLSKRTPDTARLNPESEPPARSLTL